MLRKLLKHDFKANLKVFLLVWPAIVIFGILSGFVLSESDNSLWKALYLIVPVFVITIVGSYIFALITTATRFYSGLLGREGYLMFTIPAKPWQLILSKFIVAFTSLSVTIILALISCVFLVDGLLDTLPDGLIQMESEFDISSALTILSFFCAIAHTILQIYLACALGHLFRKRRLLWTVLCYYGISIATSVVTSVLSLSSEVLSAGTDSALFLSLIIELVVCGAYFLICERILSNKLNLE